MIENSSYLTKQIITYIGNKRALLEEIDKIVKPLIKDKITFLDLFSGSGIVARFFKKYSSDIIVNDLEKYSSVINNCYLSNDIDFDIKKYIYFLEKLDKCVLDKPIKGIISELYSPTNENNITKDDRVFYTKENALLIDSYRYYIDKIIPKDYQKYFLARLITEASIHVNTSGVFKGFYKDKNTGIGKFGGAGENALKRIKGKIDLSPPVLSNFFSNFVVYQEDANELVKNLQNVDIAYLDPPYNQHPYGSNYFMLNLILENIKPSEISKVSGIPTKWNHSNYNNKKYALSSMADLIKNLKANYVLISYNNEGFIKYNEMLEILKTYGKVKVKNIKYNTFRGSRNLNNREKYTNEYLFLLTKEK